jgi:hypothetical protein
MREPLRARLEALAKRRGVSLNTELVDRVEQSLSKEDSFGGPEVAMMARLMSAAFLLGGQRAAHRKHPKWTVSEWINNPACYGAAVAAVVEALGAMQPRQRESWIDSKDPSELEKVRLAALRVAKSLGARDSARWSVRTAKDAKKDSSDER